MIPVNIPAFSTLLSALSTEFNYPCCKYYEKFPFNPNLVATEDQCHLGLSCFHRHYFDNLCMKTSLKRKSKNSHDHELQRVPTRVGLLCNLYSVVMSPSSYRNVDIVDPAGTPAAKFILSDREEKSPSCSDDANFV